MVLWWLGQSLVGRAKVALMWQLGAPVCALHLHGLSGCGHVGELGPHWLQRSPSGPKLKLLSPSLPSHHTFPPISPCLNMAIPAPGKLTYKLPLNEWNLHVVGTLWPAALQPRAGGSQELENWSWALGKGKVERVSASSRAGRPKERGRFILVMRESSVVAPGLAFLSP